MIGESGAAARPSNRVVVVVAALAVLVALAAALPSTSAAKPKKPLTVKVHSKGQSAILGSGRVNFAVHSRTAGSFRISAAMVGGGKTTAIVHSRRVHLPAGKTRKLFLKLTAAGRTRVSDCTSSRLKVSVNGKRRSKKGKRVSAAGSTALKLNAQRCNLPEGVDLTNADRCEFIAEAGSRCLFPFPDNYYTRKDPSTDTGLRLDLKLDSTPANVGGTHIDPTDMNRSDGFSPGAPIVTKIPGMDTPAAFAQTGAVPITKMSETYAAGQPIVLIDASTNERQLIWSELDSNATTAANTDLLIHPAKNLLEGHRYIVALRNMRDASGSVIPAPAGFRLYRDDIPTDKPVVEDRRSHFDDIFSHLSSAGIDRSNLYMAWDFTVASERNSSEALLKIRNDALAQLNDTTPGDGVVNGGVPSYTITDIRTVGDSDHDTIWHNLTGDHTVQNVREVTGTYQVPCYLDTPGCVPGGKFTLGTDGLPIRTPGNFQSARFTCNIPQSAVTGAFPYTVADDARPSMYGHGLFGDYTEVHTGDVRKLGTENDVVTCATDFTGMMEDDLGTAAVALTDLSRFQPIPDGLQQGFVNFMYLGRLLKNPAGFASNPAFQFGGQPVIAPNELYYYGNSQGGIAGGALTAMEPDLTRSVLYVPGMNYSTLLTRSIDFAQYAAVLYPSYPDEQIRPLLLSMIQMEWDRGEPNGYAQHMTTDPLPGTPAHKVLLEMAYGDHQVANVQTQVEARTIGAPLRQPALDSQRLPVGFSEPFYGQDTLGNLAGPAADGSGMFIWDIGPKRLEGSPATLFGTDPPPITNTSPDDSFGVDPHDTVIRQTQDVRTQIANFLKVNGKITDPCGAKPCYAAGWTGFP